MLTLYFAEDFIHWLDSHDYTDAFHIQYYVMPLVEYYAIKYCDIVKQAVSNYASKFKHIKKNDVLHKFIKDYIKKRSKQEIKEKGESEEYKQ